VTVTETKLPFSAGHFCCGAGFGRGGLQARPGTNATDGPADDFTLPQRREVFIALAGFEKIREIVDPRMVTS